jgi:uncharacterized protein (UPF0276 family)
MSEFKGVGVSFRPEFQTFWPAVVPHLDCIEYIPDELPFNEKLLQLTRYAVSDLPTMAHSTGLSIASPEPLSHSEIKQIRKSVDTVGAAICSDHLAFRRSGSTEIENFCLPFSDRLSLDVIIANYSYYREHLGRELILENITINGLLAKSFSLEDEINLINSISRHGIRILFDVNNCFINCNNFSMPISAYLRKIPLDAVAGLHIAGFETDEGWLIDSHMAPIDQKVAALAEEVLKSSDAQFIVLERDNGSATENEILSEIEILRGVWDRARS